MKQADLKIVGGSSNVLQDLGTSFKKLKYKLLGALRNPLNILYTFYKKFRTHQKYKDATKQKHKTLQANSKGMVVPLHQ